MERVNENLGPKSTLISLVPFPIIEEKPGLIPSRFEVAASDDGKPQCTVIGDSIHYVWIDEVRGSLKVTNPSYVVAKSIVKDYLDAQLQVGPDAYPALSWLPEVWTPERLMKEHSDKLREMARIQENWFVRLVQLADDDWQRTRQHMTISDVQRYAVKSLDPENKQGRSWVFAKKMDSEIMVPETTLCPACGSDIPKGVVICRYCQHIIDKDRYASMSFVKQQQVDLGKVLRTQ